MYKIKNYIESVGQNRVINSDIKVESGVIYLAIDNIQYKYEFGNWYQYTNRWVNLQGGVPNYIAEENLDSLLFEEVDYEPRNS